MEQEEGAANAANPLTALAELARWLWGAVVTLVGLPEALHARVLSDRELPVAQAWVRELERFVRGLIYAQALQLGSSPLEGEGGAARRGEGCLRKAGDVEAARLTRPSRPLRPSSPTGEEGLLSFRLSLCGNRSRAMQAGRRLSFRSPVFTTQRLAQRLAAAERALADPAPLARRLARRWAKNAALKARTLAQAAKPPPASHRGRVAPHKAGYFTGPPPHTLKRVLFYEERCQLAAALAALAVS